LRQHDTDFGQKGGEQMDALGLSAWNSTAQSFTVNAQNHLPPRRNLCPNKLSEEGGNEGFEFDNLKSVAQNAPPSRFVGHPAMLQT
jgi:hypothetical protein